MNFDNLTIRIKELCEKEQIQISYMDEGRKRIFRFSKDNETVCHIFSLWDLEVLSEEQICFEIERCVNKLLKRVAESK